MVTAAVAVDPHVMGNFDDAVKELAEIRRERDRYRSALARIRDVPGNDVDRLKRIAREALEEK